MSDQTKETTAEQTNAPSLNAKQASAILQFLQRTQMQGAEMPAYVDVFNTLTAIVGTEQAADQQ